MNTVDVTMVRIYLTESKLGKLLAKLHDEERVRGVTAFRGIAGFGKSGEMHSSSLLDISLDLPVVVEFFDTPDRVEQILPHIDKDMKPGHVVQWSAKVSA
jgi:hypothetical protein